MAFWNRSKRKMQTPANDTGKVMPAAARPKRRSPPVAMEVKLVALEALEGGANKKDVAKVTGVGVGTLTSWQRQYREGGVAGLSRRASSISVRRQVTAIEEKILTHRQEHPDHGVRRIRDELRRFEGVEVSAEKVRQTVNAAGVGNPAPVPHGRKPQVRRFERPLPNMMWQIDIFTFQLKRMYKVYLIGIIDDHSRYITGWGLFRQQTGEAVLEVVNGAIGQWGAPREILSDNGRQFVAWKGKTRFQRVLKQQGIQHVRSAPHHPMTLGKIERFWQTLWREYLSEAVFASFADACQRLEHWIGYYNHQRPHQGIDGACPADRFYGLADDVEQAVQQGVDQNSLKLALGQQTRPPMYLLGQLGETDVRVVRKGEDIEVKVGDAVREVIRLGTPYQIGEDGRGQRDNAEAEVAGPGRGAEIPGDRAAQIRQGGDQGALPDLRCEPPDAVPGRGSGGQGVGRRADPEAAWPQAAAEEPQADPGPGAAGQDAAEGSGAYEPEVRDRPGVAGPAAQGRTGREVAGREKNAMNRPRRDCAPPLYDWDGSEAGDRR